jgi:hypothetical protein
VGNVWGRDHLDDLKAVGMIILKWTFEMWVRGTWTGFMRIRIIAGGGLWWTRE